MSSSGPKHRSEPEGLSAKEWEALSRLTIAKGTLAIVGIMSVSTVILLIALLVTR